MNKSKQQMYMLILKTLCFSKEVWPHEYTATLQEPGEVAGSEPAVGRRGGRREIYEASPRKNAKSFVAV